MRQVRVGMVAILMVLLCGSLVQAQQSMATATDVMVPPLVNFSGVITDVNGKPLAGVVGVTFYLYKEQQGGAPLWLETQNVKPNSTGHYTVMLGSTTSQGIPANIFASGEAHWLGVQVSGQAEQPRVLLVSAPYALKAGDAETLGGLPASAFMLAAPQIGSAPASTKAPSDQSTPPPSPDVTGTGTVSYLPMWDTVSDIISSAVFQSGTGTTAKIGINNAAPVTTLDVKGGATVRGALGLPAAGVASATKGANSQPLNLVAAAFNGATNAPANQVFRWQAEPAGNDTVTPSGTLNLLFGEGTVTPAETGLHIASNGQITFAAGQTFPGTGGGGDGTVTSVATGLGLKGGPITSSGTLTIDTTVVPQLGAANTFTGNQTINGILSGTSTGFGVVGAATTGSGFSSGVAGTAASPAGYGVEGINSGSGGIGVYGYDNAGTGVSAYGVTGVSAGGTSYGVSASATGSSATGVYGSGAYGVTGSGTLWGVTGTTSAATPYGGVLGSGGGVGVKGQAASGSLTGENFYQAGVWGDAGNYGVLGTNDEAIAGEFINNDNSGSYPTMVVINNTTETHNPVFQTDSPYTYTGARHCTIDTSANLTCTGVLTGSIQGDAGKETAVYAMQSAENWLEDAGSGQLSNGSARIELDAAFAETVNAGVEYHVFLTPNGDSRGLYVSQKTATSFEVHEQGGGTSSIAFDYRIMAKRKGYENVRLEDLTDRFKQPAAPRQKTGRPVLPAEIKSVPPRIATPPVLPLVVPPRPIEPKLVQPKAVPLPHPVARASKPEVTQ